MPPERLPKSGRNACPSSAGERIIRRHGPKLPDPEELILELGADIVRAAWQVILPQGDEIATLHSINLLQDDIRQAFDEGQNTAGLAVVGVALAHYELIKYGSGQPHDALRWTGPTPWRDARLRPAKVDVRVYG